MEIRAYSCYNVTKRTLRDTIPRKPDRAVLARMSKAGMNEKNRSNDPNKREDDQ